MTLADFHVPGTQVGDVEPWEILPSTGCVGCHGPTESNLDPVSAWSGSLMAQSGRDPLFFAQLATAKQDVANVGYYCVRCHVPMSIVTGHAFDDKVRLDDVDREGVTCHLCHSMVDPLGTPEDPTLAALDAAVLDRLADRPPAYGNAMFVLDPSGVRRGPLDDAASEHESVASPFHSRSDLCGTCHDVGNLAVSRQADGTWRYNAPNAEAPDADPWAQFPLERTYTEWRLSDFARGGVDLGDRFGAIAGPGEPTGPGGAPLMQDCQDCHMPRAMTEVASHGRVRPHASHTFAGAAAQVLDLIAAHTADDPAVDPAALARGRAAAVSMLQRAATLEARQTGERLRVRVINETGHKLPTGHIEGRRVWLAVRFEAADGTTIIEHGAYDLATARLDRDAAVIYEMHVGLSAEAAAVTGRPAGPTGHMALADTVELDSRIPPRGFTNAAFEHGGAPVVGWRYHDGQHWDDAVFAVPPGAVRAHATLWYQQTPRFYIEALRDENHTDAWGDVLFALWEATGRGAPIEMAAIDLDLAACDPADCDGDGVAPPADCDDHDPERRPEAAERCNGLDDDCDGSIDEQLVGGGCDSGLPGVCGPGVWRCVDAVRRCEPATSPAVEICDGLDNDCDGWVDDRAEGTGEPCVTGQPGRCGAGSTACVAGGLVCALPSRGELCNDEDDDCDGEVDEGLRVGDACWVGFGVCRREGVRVCTADGDARCDAVRGEPSVERCNGLDDDCDGRVDDGLSLGAACTSGEGECAAEGRLGCGPDESVVCVADTPPGAPEQCNGLDDDCNGLVDDALAPGGPCSSGSGACERIGTLRCHDGVEQCDALPGEPTPEQCNGVDDDCNGEADDGVVLAGPCSVGEGACARLGALQCVEGIEGCDVEPGEPMPERCNGLDDDCDGEVDDGLASAGPCSVGEGACARLGNLRCVDGSDVCDVEPGEPTAEQCNGVDDDCDGQVDEDVALAGPCWVGEGSCARLGNLHCVDGHLGCDAQPGQPEPEQCNGLDDDCDGAVDEAIVPEEGCVTGLGACARQGALRCVEGALRCSAVAGAPALEQCNGVDDDCDGAVDEQRVCGALDGGAADGGAADGGVADGGAADGGAADGGAADGGAADGGAADGGPVVLPEVDGSTPDAARADADVGVAADAVAVDAELPADRGLAADADGLDGATRSRDRGAQGDAAPRRLDARLAPTSAADAHLPQRPDLGSPGGGGALDGGPEPSAGRPRAPRQDDGCATGGVPSGGPGGAVALALLALFVLVGRGRARSADLRGCLQTLGTSPGTPTDDRARPT